MERPSLTLALQDNQWVTIGMVPRGIACRCICPGCGASLSAKKGSKNRHHFAHWNRPECPGALESALHAFAKYLLTQASRLKVPPIRAYKNKQPLKGAAYWSILSAEQEVSRGKLRLDNHLVTDKGPLAVEIQVHHPVELRKQKQLGYLQLPCLEIDVWRIFQELSTGAEVDWDKFHQQVIHGYQYKKWLFHPWQHKWEYKQRLEAVQRKVHHTVQNQYHHYLVYGCPRKERFIRSGFREGQAYARLFQDCLHCRGNLGINYQEKWAGYRMIAELPQSVFCGYVNNKNG